MNSGTFRKFSNYNCRVALALYVSIKETVFNPFLSETSLFDQKKRQALARVKLSGVGKTKVKKSCIRNGKG